MARPASHARALDARRAWRPVAVAVAGLGLGACTAVPPPWEPPALAAPPAHWAAAGGAARPVEPAWWTSFGDARLTALVEEATAHNHDLAAAAARLQAAAIEADLAGAPAWPRLKAGFDATRQRQNFIGLPIPGSGSNVLSRTYDRFGVTLDVSWEVDLWGRIRAGRSAAAADAQAAAADFAAARESLAAQTVHAYLAAVEASLQLSLAEETAALYETTVEQVRLRVVRGVREAVDLRLARTNLATSRADLARRNEQLARARRQLELLVGRYPDGAIAAATDLPALPGVVPAGLPADLLRRRPDVLAAERRLAATDARVDEARAALFPKLSLTSSAGTSSQDLAHLVDGDYFVWNLAGNLMQPLLDGGRLRGELALAHAHVREAAAHYAQAALTAYTEVESALAAEGLLRDQLAQLEDASREATAARELAEDRYRRGVGDFLAVLEAQRRALVTAVQRLEVRRRIDDVRVDLHLALGGGFEPASDARDAVAVSGR